MSLLAIFGIGMIELIIILVAGTIAALVILGFILALAGKQKRD